MEFEWDQDKSDACYSQRGFDFAYVLQAFLDPDRVIRQDTRRDYGEDRYQLIGLIGTRLFFVVYTSRGATIRIISARKANNREAREYEDSTSED